MGRGFFPKSLLQVARPSSRRVSQCGACGLLKSCQTPKMTPSGTGRRKILIVGEAPGEEEDRRGKQFVGKAGQRLRQALIKAGLDPDKDCWFTNSLICRPPNNETPNNARIGYCRPNLIQTIEALQPEVIVPLGTVAVRSVFGYFWKDGVASETITRWAGWRIPHQKTNTWICPSYHPSYVMRQEEKRDKVPGTYLERHLDAVSELSGRPWETVPDYQSQIQVVTDAEVAARKIRKMIQTDRIVSFDYETNMLKPDSDKARIVCCSLSDGERTFAFPWHGEAVQAMREFLESKTPKAAYNMKFEDRWSRKILGVKVRGWLQGFDGMLGSHLLDNRSEITGLKFQAFVLLGQEAYDDHIKPYLKASGGNEENRIREVNLTDLLVYNGMDSLMERLVSDIQMRQLGLID